MAAKLSEELRQALSRQPDRALEVEDPVTHKKYVLVRMEVYERLRRTLPCEESESDPRDFYAAFAEAAKEDIDAPGMELYDDYDSHRKQP